MWYVIQTVTGKEQELMKAIENVLVGNKREETYKRCFTLERECIWRIEGQFRIHIEPLFPSYVIAETDNPDAFFIALKQVPKLAKLLGAEGNFWSIGAYEEQFLHNMIETARKESNLNASEGSRAERYIVQRSLVHVDANGQIVSAEGALRDYWSQIVKQRLRKRSVIIEIPFLGETRRIQLGIRLDEDKFH